MKVPTLLEALSEIQKQALMHPIVGKSAMANVNNRYRNSVDAAIEFYSIPFTPEMLVGEKAIFAGWRYCPENDHLKSITDGKNEIVIEDNMLDYYPDSGYEIWNICPQTIDDFISDCNRAGIPLTFTEYGKRLFTGAQEIPNALNEDPNRSDGG